MKKLVKTQQKPKTPEFIFPVVLSLLMCQTAVTILVKRLAYVMLPVDLQREGWYNNTALRILKKLSKLIRPKRFVTSLILGISALIAILTTFAIHTANFINEINRNIPLALSKQSIIDKKFKI